MDVLTHPPLSAAQLDAIALNLRSDAGQLLLREIERLRVVEVRAQDLLGLLDTSELAQKQRVILALRLAIAGRLPSSGRFGVQQT